MGCGDPSGCLSLLIYWTEKGDVGKEEAMGMLDELVSTGYRLGSAEYVALKQTTTS